METCSNMIMEGKPRAARDPLDRKGHEKSLRPVNDVVQY